MCEPNNKRVEQNEQNTITFSSKRNISFLILSTDEIILKTIDHTAFTTIEKLKN